MNERIKALVEQATTEEHDGFRYFDKAKFAELIVEECMEQVWYSREDGINGNISQVIKDRIKEHFGVEE